MSFTEIMSSYWVEMLIISLIVMLAMCTLYLLVAFKFKVKDRPGTNKALVVFAYIGLFIVADVALIATLLHRILIALIIIAVFAAIVLICGIYLLVRKVNSNKQLECNNGYRTNGKLVYTSAVENFGKSKKKKVTYYCAYIEYVNAEGNVATAKSVVDLTFNEVAYLYHLELVPVTCCKKYCKVIFEVPVDYEPTEDDIEKYSKTYKVKKKVENAQ